MNEQKIEELLKKAPEVSAPAGLAERLKNDIKLPRTDNPGANGFDSRSWFKRWFPAFALGTFFLTCIVALGVQMNVATGLKGENQKLRASAQDLTQLRADNVEYQRLFAASQDADQLQQEHADLLRLREALPQLQADAQEAQRLLAENQALQSQIQAVSKGGSAPDFFGDAKAQADKIKCVNNLKQIGLAARIWAGDNNDAYPSNFISMKNELNNWVVLQCPSDQSRSLTSWADVEAGNVSYILLTPVEETYPASVLAYCPIHHTYCLADGSVQQLSPEGVQKNIKVVDGRLTYVWPTQ
jgi:hypothetical protein